MEGQKGDSAVILAVTRYNLAALKELVRAGADLNLQDQEELTALMISSRSGRTILTETLLSGDKISLDIQSANGWSALLFAVDEGDIVTTELLLKAGANPHLSDINGLTAMDVAVIGGHEDVRQLLWEHMQKQPIINPPIDPPAQSTQKPPQSVELSQEPPQPVDQSQGTSNQSHRPSDSSQELPKLFESSQEHFHSTDKSVEPPPTTDPTPKSLHSSQESPQSVDSSQKLPHSEDQSEGSASIQGVKVSPQELVQTPETTVQSTVSQALTNQVKNARLWVKQAFNSLQERVTRSAKKNQLESGKKNQQESAGVESPVAKEGVHRQEILPPVEDNIIEDY